MPLLYYWRSDNYDRDLDLGAGYHLNQANPLLHEIELGDSLWAFTRNRAKHYVLAAELVVRAKTHNRPGFGYGPYRLWGDIERSRYFQVDGQPSMEMVIRSLSCSARAEVLGRPSRVTVRLGASPPRTTAFWSKPQSTSRSNRGRASCPKSTWKPPCCWERPRSRN